MAFKAYNFATGKVKDGATTTVYTVPAQKTIILKQITALLNEASDVGKVYLRRGGEEVVIFDETGADYFHKEYNIVAHAGDKLQVSFGGATEYMYYSLSGVLIDLDENELTTTAAP